MFRREVKRQFNENKYNLLTYKGMYAQTHQQKRPFQKVVAGSVCLSIFGFNVTKRYFTFPHYHKDTSHPLTLANGELHPFEKQPAVSGKPIKKNCLRSKCLTVSTFSFFSPLRTCWCITSTRTCTEQRSYGEEGKISYR